MIRALITGFLIVVACFSGVAQAISHELITVCNRTIQINELEHDFGTINNGDKANFKFELKNLKNEPLVIKHVTTSCGCTSPEWTKKPIKFKRKGIVKITYDTRKSGKFNKSVYVYTNFQEQPIHFKVFGTIVPLVSEKGSISKKTHNIDGNLPIKQ